MKPHITNGPARLETGGFGIWYPTAATPAPTIRVNYNLNSLLVYIMFVANKLGQPLVVAVCPAVPLVRVPTGGAAESDHPGEAVRRRHVHFELGEVERRAAPCVPGLKLGGDR